MMNRRDMLKTSILLMTAGTQIDQQTDLISTGIKELDRALDGGFHKKRIYHFLGQLNCEAFGVIHQRLVTCKQRHCVKWGLKYQNTDNFIFTCDCKLINQYAADVTLKFETNKVKIVKNRHGQHDD